MVVLDDEDRENEGDLIIPAEKVTAADVAFMVNHTSGLICVGMEGKDLDRLELPLMVDESKVRGRLLSPLLDSIRRSHTPYPLLCPLLATGEGRHGNAVHRVCGLG